MKFPPSTASIVAMFAAVPNVRIVPVSYGTPGAEAWCPNGSMFLIRGGRFYEVIREDKSVNGIHVVTLERLMVKQLHCQDQIERLCTQDVPESWQY